MVSVGATPLWSLCLRPPKKRTQMQMDRVVKTIIKNADYLNNFLNFLLRLLGDRIVWSAAQVLANLNTQFLRKLIRKRGLGNCRHLPQGFLPQRRRQPRERTGKEFCPWLIAYWKLKKFWTSCPVLYCPSFAISFISLSYTFSWI